MLDFFDVGRNKVILPCSVVLVLGTILGGAVVSCDFTLGVLGFTKAYYKNWLIQGKMGLCLR
ncbi:MAG: hypothetical protein IJ599_03385 [Alphaproteobacteria bacterium]|nr:hypothetical protein [Alphaproteobacteria bacterium]